MANIRISFYCCYITADVTLNSTLPMSPKCQTTVHAIRLYFLIYSQWQGICSNIRPWRKYLKQQVPLGDKVNCTMLEKHMFQPNKSFTLAWPNPYILHSSQLNSSIYWAHWLNQHCCHVISMKLGLTNVE